MLSKLISNTAPTEKTVLKAWEYCEERSCSIEVVYRDEGTKEEALTRVHFNVNVEVRAFPHYFFCAPPYTE